MGERCHYPLVLSKKVENLAISYIWQITIDEGQFIAVCSQFIDFVNSQQAAGKFSSSVEPVERKPDGGMTKNCSTAQGEGRLVVRK